MGQIDTIPLLIRCREKHNFTGKDFLTKNAQLKSNHKGTSDKPKLRGILQNN